MNKTQRVCHNSLSERIAECRHLFKCAEDCLKDNDYLQCAVRLEEAGERLHFAEFAMNIFDTMTIKNDTTTNEENNSQ